LNYFISLQVVNKETQYIIQRALQQHNINEAPVWPGIEFQFAVEKGKELDMEAALAILGMLPLPCFRSEMFKHPY
jgi:hypothetical protein